MRHPAKSGSSLLVLATIRTATGLCELVSEALPDTGYRTTVRPAQTRPDLVSAWQKLADVQISELDIPALTIFLRETRPDPRAAPVAFEPPKAAKPRPIATAAHPRAYKGTRTQPPKPATPPTLDLRPVLACATGTLRLLSYLGLPSRLPEKEPLSFELSIGAVVGSSRKEWLALFRALELQRYPLLLASLTRLSAQAPGAIQWAQALLTHAKRRRPALLSVILETEAFRNPYPGDDLFVQLTAIPVADHSATAQWMCRCLRLDAAAQHLKLGLKYVPRIYNRPIVGRVVGDFALLEALLQRKRFFLWHTSGRWHEPLWMELTEDECYLALHFLANEPAHQLHQQLAKLPREYWRKFLAGLERHSGADWKLRARLCSPPFREMVSWWYWDIWRARSHNGAEEAVLNLPDKTFLAAEKATQVDSTAYLVSAATSRLLSREPQLTLDLLQEYPRAFFAQVAVLATLHEHLERNVWERWRAHPLNSEVLLELKAEAILRDLPSTALHRVPPRIRAGAPRPADWQKLQAVLNLCRLELLVSIARTALCEELGLTATDEMVYSAGMAGEAGENRRLLRRFLRNWAQGKLTQHPANLRWLAARPQFNLQLWLRGPDFESPGMSLSVEHDPTEILQMGRYSKTCTALGGGQSYSAAAVLLDINKGVVFARDLAGKVIARQILAVADDNRLVAFRVYPSSVKANVRELLGSYEAKFAAELGVKICKEQPYQVSLLAAKEWWDDGVR